MRKKHSQNYLITKITAIAALVVFILFSLINFFINSDIFTVKEINIDGVVSYNEKDIIDQIYLYSVIDNNKLAHLNERNIIFWILSKEEMFLNDKLFPSLSNISIRNNIFKRTVDISVSEKRVAGVICNNRECYAFDDRGIVFRKSPRTQGFLITKISDPHNRPIVFGEMFLGNKLWVDEIFSVVKILDRMGLTMSDIILRDPQIREWEVDIINGPTLYFSFGSLPENFENVFRALKNRVNISEISYTDFRVEGRIYYQ